MARKPLNFHFEPNLDYQLDAIQSVVKIFEGMPRVDAVAEEHFSADIVANMPPNRSLVDGELFENVLWTNQNKLAQSGKKGGAYLSMKLVSKGVSFR